VTFLLCLAGLELRRARAHSVGEREHASRLVFDLSVVSTDKSSHEVMFNAMSHAHLVCRALVCDYVLSKATKSRIE
jgi:hypothetical protein